MSGNRQRSFRKFNTTDEELNRLQDNIENAVSNVIKAELLDGRLITGVQLNVTATKLSHKLDRKIVGYIVVSSNNLVTISDNIASGSDLEMYVELTASSPATVNLWVF